MILNNLFNKIEFYYKLFHYLIFRKSVAVKMQRASWKEMLTGDLHDDTESLSFKQGKVLTYIALVFEILGIIIVAICAIWIRYFSYKIIEVMFLTSKYLFI